MPSLVEIAFPLPLDGTFTYDLPETHSNIQIGQRVLAPFQKRLLTGYVMGFPKEAGEFELRPIEAVLDDSPLLTAELIDLTKSMARFYGVPFGEALKTALPPGLIRQTKRTIVPTKKEGLPPVECSGLWSRILKSRKLDYLALVRRNPGAARQLKILESEGFVEVQALLRKERASTRTRETKKNLDALYEAKNVELTSEQQEALNGIQDALASKRFQTLLLHGITGSGKTELYLRATHATLESGKNVFAMVPEISLTPQFVGRFRSRVGDQIAVLHSGRSESERLKDWLRIRAGEVRVVIGARSAIFAPLSNVGLIILDEEHDASYKQSEGLKYHSKELARFRAVKENAVLLLGSATPSLETYYQSTKGEIRRLELQERPLGNPLPNVEVIDLRATSTPSASKSWLTEAMLCGLADTLGRREQAILFLNRRGFAPTMLCPTCGEGVRCTNCSVTLTFHAREKKLLCHYCGFFASSEQPCIRCGQTHLLPLGVGTEKIEEELALRFPDAKIDRMDRDSVRRKGAHDQILSRFLQGKTDILVGTQMVTKGLDHPNVTFVGVLSADQSLHFPDFRSAERTFQLLTQVVGRAGRGANMGRAVIQSFGPDHYAIKEAVKQNYQDFYTQEIRYREELGYPPFQILCLLELSSKNEMAVRQSAIWLKKQAERSRTSSTLSFLGPAPALISKIEGRTRMQFFVRSNEKGECISFARWLAKEAKEALEPKAVQVDLDIDPISFL